MAKIGDLGVAKVLKSAFTQTVIGTPFYISPEIWRKQPYNSKSDMWSLGCVLYEMCMLRHPFNASSPKELSQKILRCSYPPVIGYSDDMKNMVNTLLCVEAATRPCATDVLADPLIKCRMNLIPKACAAAAAADPAPARTATAASLSAGTFGAARPVSGSAAGGAAGASGGSTGGSAASASAGGEGGSPVRPPEASTRTAAATEQILRTIAVPRNLSRIHLPPPAYVTPVSEQRTLSFLDEVQTATGAMSVSKLCLDDDDVEDAAAEGRRAPKPAEGSSAVEHGSKEEHQKVATAAGGVVATTTAPVGAPVPAAPPAAAVQSAQPASVPPPVSVPAVASHSAAAPVDVLPLPHVEAPHLGQPPAKRHFKFDSQPFKDPLVPAAPEPAHSERRAAVRRSTIPHTSAAEDALAPTDRLPSQRFVFRRPSIAPSAPPAVPTAASVEITAECAPVTSSSRVHEARLCAEPPPVVPAVPEAAAPTPAPAPAALPATAPTTTATTVEPPASTHAESAFVAPVGVPAHAPVSDRDRHNMMVQKFLRQRRHSVFFRPPQLLSTALENAQPPPPAEAAPPPSASTGAASAATAAPPLQRARRPSVVPASRAESAVRRPSVVPLLARPTRVPRSGAENSPAAGNTAVRHAATATGSSGHSGFAEPFPVAFGAKHAARRPSVALPQAGSASGGAARRPSVVPGAGAAHRSTATGSSSSARRASVAPAGRKSTLPVWR